MAALPRFSARVSAIRKHTHLKSEVAPSSRQLLCSFKAIVGSAVATGAALFCSPLSPSTGVVAMAAASPIGAGQASAEPLPELLTEYMVDMKCENCVKGVRSKLEPLAGVVSINIDLPNNIVRVLGTTPVKDITDAIAASGRPARLIGQGDPAFLQLTAAVAEFKGPVVFGVVRFIQVSQEMARVEAQLDGLSACGTHGWSVNEYGDLTDVPRSTGGYFDPNRSQSAQGGGSMGEDRPAGNLGNLTADAQGHAEISLTHNRLKVWDLIGRSVVIGNKLGKAPPGGPSLAGRSAAEGLPVAAVIARSAGVGENYKSLCTCDGTVIWEATNHDFVKQG